MKKQIRLSCLKCLIAIGLICSSFALQAKPDVDLLLEQARIRLEAQDLEGAAAAYHKVLQLDEKNTEARQGLADAIVRGNIKDPHAEQADVLNPMMEEKEESII